MGELAITGGQRTKKTPWASWPRITNEDQRLVLEAINSGMWGEIFERGTQRKKLSYHEIVEERMEKFLQCRHALLVTNGTMALEIALQALGIKPGEEVIVTSYSYIASATCIMKVGAVPVFVDIDGDNSWNMDIGLVEEAIGKRTRAIVVVHMCGNPVNMDQIMRIAKENELFVIEDAAHAFGAEWKERKVGTLGDIGCYSFQETKNLTCGEGGMIVTNSDALYEKLYSIHTTGRLLGKRWYAHYYLGTNARMTEFQAALLLAQYNKFEFQNNQRLDNALKLRKELEKIEGISCQLIDYENSKAAFHILGIEYQKEKWHNVSRNRIIRALNCEGIVCSAGYGYPIYKNPVMESYNIKKQMCYQTERLCKNAIWFPHYMLLAEEDEVRKITMALIKIKENIRELE